MRCVEPMKPSKNRNILLFTLIISFGFVNLITPVSCLLEERPNISAKGNWYKSLEFSSTEPVDFIIKTEANVTIWFMERDEFGTYVVNNTLPTESDLNSIQHGEKKGDVYEIRQKWTIDFLNQTYNLTKECTPGSDVVRILFYIYIINSEDFPEYFKDEG